MADDQRILARHYDLETFISSGPLALLGLLRRIRNSDVVVTWFGSVYSGFNTLLAHLAHKPSIIVLGGVDASKHKSIGYGIWLSPWKVPFVRYAFRHADLLLPVDPSLAESAKRLAGYDGSNLHYLPTGYSPEEWPLGEGVRENVVLTVAKCDNVGRLRVKGVDVLLAAAREMADVKFRLIGVVPRVLDALRERPTANVEILPPMARDRLAAEYGRAKVYCQPSFSEGLPNTLCEAMLCGCIPVGTAVGGIPTAIGEAGFLAPRGDLKKLTGAIREALASPADRGLAARARIAAEFSVERRERGLCAVIDSLVDWKS